MDNKKVAKGCGRERIADGCQTDGKRQETTGDNNLDGLSF